VPHPSDVRSPRQFVRRVWKASHAGVAPRGAGGGAAVCATRGATARQPRVQPIPEASVRANRSRHHQGLQSVRVTLLCTVFYNLN